jgi:predicted transcriptional regulator
MSALARSLDRQYRRVHADVTALEQAVLLVR